MRKDDLATGKKYALRPKEPDPEQPFIKVTYIGPVRSRQCRIRYEEGELSGLEEWVPTRMLACPWGERKALLRDEERRARLEGADIEVWDRVAEWATPRS